MRPVSEFSFFGIEDNGILKEVQESRVLPWVAINGDDTRRLDYALNKKSVVYDIGGYIGDWAAAIDEKFSCHIEIFEPIAQYSKLLSDKFKGNSNIVVHDFGLAGKTGNAKISLESEASSVFKTTENYETIHLERVSKHINHDFIDLMKMNIEGSEFDLLDDLIKTNKIGTIGNLQIQFHDFAPDAIARRKKLQKTLSATHVMTYNYPFVWENWRLKNGA